jgi:hypothetical protein
MDRPIKPKFSRVSVCTEIFIWGKFEVKLPTISNWAKSTSKRPTSFSRKIKVDILENEIAYFDQNSMLIPNTYICIYVYEEEQQNMLYNLKVSIYSVVHEIP